MRLELDGRLKHAAWSGLQWIWSAAELADTTRVCFRYSFELHSVARRAWLQVWSASGYALSVNGASAYTSPRGTLWTHRDEIEHLLQTGTNTLEVEYYLPRNSTPGLIAAGEVELADGTTLALRSDTSWQCNSEATVPVEDGPFEPNLFAEQVARHYGADDAQQLHIDAKRYVAFRGGGYWSPLERLADGSLGMVVRAGGCHSGRDGRLYFIRSSDGGMTWSSPTVVADSPWNDYQAALGAPRDGSLVVGYRKLRNYDGAGNVLPRNEFPPVAETLVVRSEDGGHTWGEPEVISQPGAPANCPCSRMLEHPDGSLWMVEYRSQGATNSAAFYRASRDSGRQWDPPRPITTGLSAGTTSVTRLRDGRLVAALRGFISAGEAMFISMSDNGGNTWTEPVRITEPGEFPADVTELASGRLLLTVGRRAFPGGVQILMSDDRGETWQRPRRFILSSDAFHDHGWPASIQLPDGTIVTTSYATGHRRHPEVGVHIGVMRWREPA